MAGRRDDEDEDEHLIPGGGGRRYDAHRNDADDPVIVDALRRPADPGSPTAIATTPPTIERVSLAIGDYPVGGQIVTLTNPAGAGVAPMQNILLWTSPDGVARKATLVLSCKSPIITTPFVANRVWPAYYCKVTVGTSRGSSSFWVTAPEVIPVEGTYIRVDAQLAPSSGGIGSALFIGNASFAGPPAFTNAQTFSGPVQAVLFDNASPDQWKETQLGPSDQVSGSSGPNNGVLFNAPCILTSCKLNNNNVAAGVWMAIADVPLYQQADAAHTKQVVFVPAQSSVNVGRDLLGSFSNAVCVYGRSNPSGAAGYNPAEDANDANVFVTLRGIQPMFS